VQLPLAGKESMARRKRAVRKNSLPIYTRTLPSGQINCMVDRRTLGGEPKWKTFFNKDNAEIHAHQAWIERQNQGIEVFRTPQELKLEAMRCQGRLKPRVLTDPPLSRESQRGGSKDRVPAQRITASDDAFGDGRATQRRPTPATPKSRVRGLALRQTAGRTSGGCAPRGRYLCPAC